MGREGQLKLLEKDDVIFVKSPDQHLLLLLDLLSLSLTLDYVIRFAVRPHEL